MQHCVLNGQERLKFRHSGPKAIHPAIQLNLLKSDIFFITGALWPGTYFLVTKI